MSQIRKHVLATAVTRVVVAGDAQLLAVGSYVPWGRQQRPEHAIWTLEDTHADARQHVWMVRTATTGDYLTARNEKHLGSHVGVDGAQRPYVTHYFLTRAEA